MQLIAQVLFGFNTNGSCIDIDKLVNMLEQNRDLLHEMAVKEDFEGIDEGSFLPKLLYDLFLQVNQESAEEVQGSAAVKDSVSTPEEIAEKLPKVWRVLIELLSHQKKLSEEEEERVVDCYKSVQTATGPQNVLSVSKTFIKLKDLILEKRSLQKDTTRLKTLYSHLEQRLDKQEKRLSTVSLELTKTWHLVGKIKVSCNTSRDIFRRLITFHHFQRQNRQLHTHEQILCYQLQQKKRLLSELKAELEYCRKKWALARALNSESEEQCKQLRHEFSMRKIQDQNSAESGYSDEHPSDADGDDDEAGTSKQAIKVQKFDDNLMKFDRTASPTYSERRKSESPLIHEFSHLCLFSRAQSEPPRLPTNIVDGDEPDAADLEVFEILDLIPDPVHERCVAEPVEENSGSVERLVVTPPPEVLVHDPPKLKAHLRKHKVRKQSNGKQTETAEEMYMRLMGITKDECSTCSSTTSIGDEHDEADVEEIQELPLDEPIITTEDTVKVIEEVEIVQEEVRVVQDVLEIEPQPSTSAQKDDISLLSTKEQEYLSRREERLARLEAEAKAFYDRMARNKEKGTQLNNHINDIHQTFLVRNRERTNSEDEKSKDEATTSGEAEKKKKERKDDESGSD